MSNLRLCWDVLERSQEDEVLIKAGQEKKLHSYLADVLRS